MSRAVRCRRSSELRQANESVPRLAIMPRLTEVFGGRLQGPAYPLCGPLRVAAQAQGGQAGGLRGGGGGAGEGAGAPEARERHDRDEVRFRLASFWRPRPF